MGLLIYFELSKRCLFYQCNLKFFMVFRTVISGYKFDPMLKLDIWQIIVVQQLI